MRDGFGLYLVITEPVAGYEAVAEAAVAEQVGMIQLRAKRRAPEERAALADALRAITRGSSTRFIVNDDPRLAFACGADGVHVGQDDASVPEARRLAPGRIVGLSTHSPAQVEAAMPLRPDYIGVGPVFATPTKEHPDPVLGLDTMRDMLRRTAVPAVAIGGIDAKTLPAVLQAGAVNFAVVRAVCADPDPRGAIRRLMALWRAHSRPPPRGA